MKRITLILFALFFVLGVSRAEAATIGLWEWALNQDGNVTSGGSQPDNVNTDAFNDTTGLGTVTITTSGEGDHLVLGFFDHEILEFENTYFNEFGDEHGIPATDQSWEIDEPGYVFGDIYDNFSDSPDLITNLSALDNFNNVPAGSEDDVSMAMGWDFLLELDETATITMLLSTIAPSGFYLEHTDPDSGESIYFSSTLDIAVVPIPSAILLLGSGLAGLAGLRKKFATANIGLSSMYKYG